MLGKLELEVMEILWASGEMSVNDVVPRLERSLAYTTVMTTLDRLHKKGLLSRRKVERAFVYFPKVTRPEWERQLADNWFAAFLSTSKQSGDLLISCLLDAVSEQDVALLDEMERKIALKRKELEQGTEQ